MAGLEGSLRTYVLCGASVATLLSDRFYAWEAPQETAYPYCVFHTVSDPVFAQTFDNTETRQPRIQIDVFSDDPAEVLAVEDALIDRLRWVQGTVGSVDTTVITIQNRTQIREPDSEAFHGVLDIIVEYTEL